MVASTVKGRMLEVWRVLGLEALLVARLPLSMGFEGDAVYLSLID